MIKQIIEETIVVIAFILVCVLAISALFMRRNWENQREYNRGWTDAVTGVLKGQTPDGVMKFYRPHRKSTE